MLYAFILGIHPNLSLAEIAALLQFKKYDFQLKDSSDQFAIFEMDKLESPQDFLNQLGGTIRIAEVKMTTEISKTEAIAKIISTSLPNSPNKFSFGVSAFGLRIANKDLVTIKKKLKKLKLKPRFTSYQSHKPILSSAQVTKNRLLKEGGEIILIKSGTSNYIGKTVAVQNFESYSQRDHGRPERNPKTGMLPPKLAQIMINLGRGLVDSDNPILLDPFCGVGTILQEAMLMKMEAIGADADGSQIERARKNLEWLNRKRETEDEKWKIPKLIPSPVEKLDKHLIPNSIDLIVTEPYLGPPQERPLTNKEADLIIHQLTSLYLKHFEGFLKVLKPNGVIVIVFPVFKGKNDEEFGLTILDDLIKIGYTRIEPMKRFFSRKGELTYSRPDQVVKREIMIFGKC